MTDAREMIEELQRKQHAWHEEVAPRSVDLLDYCLRFAIEAHGKQRRLYTLEPYVHHPVNVARLVGEVFPDVDMIMAAYLHDVVEDTDVLLEEIAVAFGPSVARLVNGLTDEYTKENYPQHNRDTRHRLEAERLGKENWMVQTVKAADMCDNTCSIARYNPGYAPKYLDEKLRVFKLMHDCNRELRALGFLLYNMNRC